MRIYIGPFRKWWGPYQVADLLQYIGLSEDGCYRIGEKLSNTKLNDICQWIESKKKRKVRIKIHNYDTWSMDHTLALIIVPMLEQLKKTSHGAPHTDDEDVPEDLKSIYAPIANKNNGEVDDLYFKRWDWIMDEMIWAFSQVASDEDSMAPEFNKRMENGFRLFGKYYRGMWD